MTGLGELKELRKQRQGFRLCKNELLKFNCKLTEPEKGTLEAKKLKFHKAKEGIGN